MTNRFPQFEQLERRQCAAIAEFHVNLLDDAGEPIETVHVGDSFFLEIVVEDVQDNPSGLHGISLDLKWDAAVFAVADPFDAATAVTDSLPLLAFGSLEADIGRINDLGGSAAIGFGLGALVGANGPERFALIRFEALQAADHSQFTLRGGKHGIAFYPPILTQLGDFYFERQEITVRHREIMGPLEADEYFASLPATSSEECL